MGGTSLLVQPLGNEGNAFLFVVARGRKVILYTSLKERINVDIFRCGEMFFLHCIALSGFKLYFWGFLYKYALEEQKGSLKKGQKEDK